MNTEAATTAAPETTINPEPFQELPEVFYDDARDSAQRSSQKIAHVAPALDEEEVFEFEQPNGSDGYPSLTPLDRRFSRTTTPVGSPQDKRGAARVAAANQ